MPRGAAQRPLVRAEKKNDRQRERRRLRVQTPRERDQAALAFSTAERYKDNFRRELFDTARGAFNARARDLEARGSDLLAQRLHARAVINLRAIRVLAVNCARTVLGY